MDLFFQRPRDVWPEQRRQVPERWSGLFDVRRSFEPERRPEKLPEGKKYQLLLSVASPVLKSLKRQNQLDSIRCKHNVRWHYLSRMKVLSFSFIKKVFSIPKCSRLLSGINNAIYSWSSPKLKNGLQKSIGTIPFKESTSFVNFKSSRHKIRGHWALQKLR